MRRKYTFQTLIKIQRLKAMSTTQHSILALITDLKSGVCRGLVITGATTWLYASCQILVVYSRMQEKLVFENVTNIVGKEQVSWNKAKTFHMVFFFMKVIKNFVSLCGPEAQVYKQVSCCNGYAFSNIAFRLTKKIAFVRHDRRKSCLFFLL